MKIRPYRPSDARACTGLFQELSEAHRIIYDTRTVGSTDPARTFRAHLREVGARNTWVAIDSGRVVGLVGLIPHRGYGEVDPIVVTKDYRRRRIARKLLQTVVEEAQRRKWKVLTIKPVARNSVALRTFHAMGFRTLVNIELHMALKGSGWFVPRPGPRLAGKAFLH